MVSLKLVLVLASLVGCVFSQDLPVYNIHFKLSPEAEQTAIALNAALTAQTTRNGIDFQKFQPHVTLYLTTFSKDATVELSKVVCQVAATAEACLVELEERATLNGTYAFWNVQNNLCIQRLSDRILSNTLSYTSANKTVPAWVQDLPEPQRSDLTKKSKLFGSPGVLDGFQPHVTIGYDQTSDGTFKSAIPTLAPPKTAFAINRLAVGVVGPYGTVVRGSDVIVCPLAGAQ
eukprot:Colp12_sorted_trinity150504_noHs@27377